MASFDIQKFTGNIVGGTKNAYQKCKSEIILAYKNAPEHGAEFSPTVVKEQRLLSCLSYVSILCVVPFIMPLINKKEIKYANFHARQGVKLLAVEAAAWVVLGLLSNIPLIGWIFSLAKLLVDIGCAAASVKGIMDVLKGRARELPIVSKYIKL